MAWPDKVDCRRPVPSRLVGPGAATGMVGPIVFVCCAGEQRPGPSREHGAWGAQCQKCQKPPRPGLPQTFWHFWHTGTPCPRAEIGACARNCVSTADVFPCHLGRLARKYLLTPSVSDGRPRHGGRLRLPVSALTLHGCQLCRRCVAIICHLRPYLSCPAGTLGFAMARRLLTAIDTRGYDPLSWTWGHPVPSPRVSKGKAYGEADRVTALSKAPVQKYANCN